MEKSFQIFKIVSKELLKEDTSFYRSESGTETTDVTVLEPIETFNTEEECIAHLTNIKDEYYFGKDEREAEFTILPIYTFSKFKK